MKGKKWFLALAAVLCLMGTAWAGEKGVQALISWAVSR